MHAFPDQAYLAALSDEQRGVVVQVNDSGLTRLRDGLASGDAVAFLGAGASAPLYPLWDAVVAQLVDAAATYLTAAEVATCRALRVKDADAVVEVLRKRLDANVYREALREVFKIRRDPATGRTWTATHELIVRCAFRGVVTTNYDPGIVDARMALRPRASSTGFASYSDELALDEWQTMDVFRGGDELPVLFAHGHHNQPDRIVLATTEYRRAYRGRLPDALSSLMDAGPLVWVGFSFADKRIAAILQRVGDRAGSWADPGRAPRHVVLLPWDHRPADGDPLDPGILRDICNLQYNADVVLYPAHGADHSALAALLEQFADPRFPPAAAYGAVEIPSQERPDPAARDEVPAPASPEHPPLMRWVHGGDPVDHFSGRAEELARLDRWMSDPSVRLVGVTAWGGAGKTALITESLVRRDSAQRRPELRGVFGWSFYENDSEDAWATALVEWAQSAFDLTVDAASASKRVLAVAQMVPLVLVLDGLEVLQEGPSGTRVGRLLGGLLRDVLTALCRVEHHGLMILTSRFAFTDLEQFDGGAARMLDVPALTAAEGAEVLKRAGAVWLPDAKRRELVSAVHGHALAVGALAGALADRSPSGDLPALIADLERAGRTDARVRRALSFYSERLDDQDRALVAIVSLFQRPVSTDTILTLGTSAALDRALAGRTAADIRAAVQQRLSGLLSWHANGTVSSHPLVRESFRALALTPGSAQLASELELKGLPAGRVRSREQAVRVVEIVELLLHAGEWDAADELYRARTDDGVVWRWLPAASLGQRCALAFVGTPDREAACRLLLPGRFVSYLNVVGLTAMNTGELETAEAFFKAVLSHVQGESPSRHSRALQNLGICLGLQGHASVALTTAEAALELAREAGDSTYTRCSLWQLGRACDMAGQTLLAQQRFREASDLPDPYPGSDQLYPLRRSWWVELLLRTGHAPVARTFAEFDRELSARKGWNQSVARFDRLLGLCELADDRLERAGELLMIAAGAFRDGDMVVELGLTLVDLAEQQRRSGLLDEAQRTCEEAIGIVRPRVIVPTHAAALACRARILADRGADGRGRDIVNALDDAGGALRLATSTRALPWQQLNALCAYAHIDRVGATDGGWAKHVDALHKHLVPEEARSDSAVKGTRDRGHG